MTGRRTQSLNSNVTPRLQPSFFEKRSSRSSAPARRARVFSPLIRGRLFAVILLLGGYWAQGFAHTSQARGAEGPSMAAATQFDVSTREVSLIEPGSVLDDGPPRGWSHLIIKSKPKVTKGDIAKAGKLDVELASAFFTVLAANVRDGGPSQNPRYVLDKVGVGVGAHIQGKDVVISPDTQAKLGANLGFIARMVLKSFYAEQMDVRVVLSSGGLMVIDTPVVMRMKERNELSIVRHGLVLDQQTGKLDKACWLLLLSKGEKPRGMAGKLEWLKENHLENAELFLDKREYRLGMATKMAYGLITPPLGGFSTDVSESQLGCLCAKPFTAEKAQELAALLQKSERIARKGD